MTVTGLVAAVGIAGHTGVAQAAIGRDPAGALTVARGRPPAYDTRTITVKFRPATSVARMEGVAGETGCRTAAVSLYTPGLRTLRVPEGGDVWQYIARYRARLDVEYAGPTCFEYPALTPNDPQFGEQWNFPLVRVPEAWDKLPSGGSQSVIVAVLDTGVAYENRSDASGDYIVAPDLDGAHFVFPRDVVNDDAHPNDDYGHGTHVCGTIAQRTNNGVGVAGVAFNVSIMPVKTLPGAGGGTTVQFSDGVHWAVDHGAKVINYSGGSALDDQVKRDAVSYAYDNGVLLIAAAGNLGVGSLDFPGAYPQAMGVGAVTPSKTRASYSNYGDGLDVVAPGGALSPATSGVLQNTFAQGSPLDMGYYYMVGTSMATPHVSGLAALLWSSGAYTTRQAVKSRIEQTCQDLGVAGYDTSFGWGLIDAAAALPGTPPVLSWVGQAGYEAEGLDPETGLPNSTLFVFKVKVTDVDGDAPTVAQVRVMQLNCNGTWSLYKALNMAPGAGALTTGRTYKAWTKLPNRVFRYRFVVEDANGTATGDPTTPHGGPFVTGPAILCWLGGAAYANDGVDPDAGPTGTRFTFKAKYSDSDGTAPTTAHLQIRRNGVLWRTLLLGQGTTGDLRLGTVLRTSIALNLAGTYQYRFVVDDGSGPATGAPSQWTAGPTISG